ncbi:MAG: phospholipid carrier-dependent glycosyltransferase [Actinomycetota bacterium]
MNSTLQRTIVVVGAVTLLAGVLRFSNLSRPEEKVFDETYYASDGCWYAGIDYRKCGLDDDVERSWVHPPLGKQLIAVGIDGFGNRSLGWRMAGAAAGTVTVALAGALGFLLFGSALWAGVGALLLATESLHFVQSRIAMVDVFLAMFVVLGFLLLVADRRRVDAGSRPARAFPPLQLAAGAAFGAAIASKWSGLLALLGGAILAVAWGWRRRRDERSPGLALLRAEGIGLVLAFAVVPFAVYLLTYLPWLAARGFDLGAWADQHRGMADFHLGLSTLNESGDPIHPYMSRAWTWLFLLRPVAYFWEGTDFTGAEILAIGNPALFWGGVIVIPYLAYIWRKRKDWTAGAILVAILAQYLPWLIVARPLFLFYMTPVSPFLALGAAYLLRDLAAVRVEGRPLGAPAAALLLLASVAVFFFFLPVLTGDPIKLSSWSSRMWFDGWI